MPSKSPAQHRTMEAAAHDKEFANKVGIPQSVAREYVEADERKKRTQKAFERTQALFRGGKG